MLRHVVFRSIQIVSTVGFAIALSTVSATATTVVWDGGDGFWTDPMWNGGLDAAEVFGREDGTENGHDIEIGGGSQVLYLAGPGGVTSDFRLNPVNGPTSVTLSDGASLELRSEDTDDPNGLWTEWDGDLILDGGTLMRTFGGSSASSGAIMLGSWNVKNLPDHEINVTLTNGGRIENNGMLMFGAWNEHGAGLNVTVSINDGSLDLTGGDVFVLNDEASQNADLHFYYGGIDDTPDPKEETYVINFTGPGSITVDRAGIRIHEIGPNYSSWDHAGQTYESLWDLGILQANGQSGLDGASFSQFFTVSGVDGEDDYTLTSRIGATHECDLNGDGSVDAADAGIMFGAWGTDGGDTGADKNGDNVVDAADAGQLFAAWTGDATLVTAGSSVPEPITPALIWGVAALLGYRCTRRS